MTTNTEEEESSRKREDYEKQNEKTHAKKVKDGDAPIYIGLRNRLNLSELTECGWEEAAESLYETADKRPPSWLTGILTWYAPERSVQKERTLKAEHPHAVKTFLVFLVVLLAISGFWPTYWYVLIPIFLISLLAGGYRGYIDLYLRAAWKYWRGEEIERPAISTEETVDLLIRELPKEDFGSLVDTEELREHQEALIDYRDLMKQSTPRLGKANEATKKKKSSKASQEKGKYEEDYSNFNNRTDNVSKSIEGAEKRIQKARSIADELTASELSHYKTEAMNVIAVLEAAKEKGFSDDTKAEEIRQKLSGSTEEIISKVNALLKSLEEAQVIIDTKLIDHSQLHEGKVQPLGELQKQNQE